MKNINKNWSSIKNILMSPIKSYIRPSNKIPSLLVLKDSYKGGKKINNFKKSSSLMWEKKAQMPLPITNKYINQSPLKLKE